MSPQSNRSSSPPPPSYRSGGLSPNPHQDERTPLYRNSREYLKAGKRSYKKWAILGLLIMVYLATTVTCYKQAGQVKDLQARLASLPPTPAEREAYRKEWKKELIAHQEEVESWDHERRDHVREVKEWVRDWEDKRRVYEWEKEGWERERKEWERDKEHEEQKWEEVRKEGEQRCLADKSKNFGLSWDLPQAKQCVTYGTREYTAHLVFDGNNACQQVPIEIDNRMVHSPYMCKGDGANGAFGTFRVKEELSCKPNWGELNNRGCYGQRGWHMRRWEARLWNIQAGDDEMVMCQTAPANIGGKHFDTPTRCEDRGRLGGIVGVWEFEDGVCP